MPDEDDSSSSSGDSCDPLDRDWDDWGEGENGRGGGEDASHAAAANSDGDEEETATTSLFDNSAVLPSASAALAHDAQEHGFDLVEFRKKLSLDDYGTFRVVNFIRSEVAAGRDPKPALAEAAEKRAAAGGGGGGKAPPLPLPWDDDAFLVPVNPEDPLLFYEYDDDVGEGANEGGEAPSEGQGTAAAAAASAAAEKELSALRAENEALRSALAALAAASLPPEAAAALPAPIVEALRGVGWGGGEGGGEEGEGAAPQEGGGGGGGALLQRRGGGGGGGGGGGARRPPSSASSPSGAADAAAAAQAQEKEVDDAYFDSYGGLGIHREMLSDEARTGAYRRALEENPSLMKGATVLDVGAGTGVLSLFAARAGASAVVAVEASARVAALARENALANGFGPFCSSSGDDAKTTVTVVNARLEDIERLPGIVSSSGGKKGGQKKEEENEVEEEVGRVDVLVSEWMGYALFFECMLDSVILARDRFLKKEGGAILPDKAAVFIAGVSPEAGDLGFWDDVHGLDLSACAREARRHRARHGAVVAVEGGGGGGGGAGKAASSVSQVVTSEVRVHELDLLTCRVGDEAFSTAFELRVLPPSSPPSEAEAEAATTQAAAAAKKKKKRLLGGVALWFDVEFSARACPDAPVVLSTSPAAPQTHWHQALLELPSPMELASSSSSPAEEDKKVSVVRGRVSLSRGPCHRSVDVALEVQGFDPKGNAVPGTRHVGLYPFAMSD